MRLEDEDLQSQLDGIFSERLPLRCIHTLQNALREYVAVECAGSWSLAAGDISAAVGISINRETLQCFANNEKKNDRTKEFHGSQEQQRAFAGLLCESKYIGADDLRSKRPALGSAALRLAEFFGTDDAGFNDGYEGTYLYNPGPKVSGTYTYLVALTLTRSRELPVLFATERRFSSLKERADFEDEGFRDKAPRTMSGWGVFQSEDVLLIFLRDKLERRTYFPVAESSRDFALNQIVSLTLFDCGDQPEGEMSLSIQSKADSKILLFERDSDLSRKKRKTVGNIEEKSSSAKSEADEDKKRRDKKRRQAGKLLLGNVKDYAEEDRGVSGRGQMQDDSNGLTEEELGRRLWEAARFLDEDRVRTLVNNGAPVNQIDRSTGQTIIFAFGVYERWDTVQFLLDTGKCDLLIRNKNGRLLSTRVAEETGNQRWAQKIWELELEQGRKVGVIPRIKGDVPIDSSNAPSEPP